MDNNTGRKVPTGLGTEKVSPLLIQYAIPAIIAQTAASLYNMIDSVFIGHIPDVGAEAISGLATTFPFMNLSAAFGAMVGVGGATQLSVRLGQRDYDSAKHILGNLVTLNIIVGILFATFSFIFLDEILFFFGASDATLPFARDFMEIILLGNVVTHLYFGINAALRSSGHPKQAMYATIITVVMNVILAPLFIYVLGWGIRGAALATVLAQCITLTWQIRLLSNPNELLHLQRGIYKLRKNIVKGILSIGMSPFFINAAACIVVIIINKGLRNYGEDGDVSIAAYGIANRMQFIFVMVVLGLTQGMQPIVGYNYGAKRPDRVKSALMQTIFWATLVTTLGFIICEFIPETVAKAFTTDPKLIEHAAWAMQVMCTFMPFIGFQLVTTNFFQSVGLVNKSIFLSLTRQVLLLIPLLLILPLFIGEKGVWYSMPISDIIAAILTVVMLILQFRQWNREGIEKTTLKL
ncbi:MAG: MATE family efflux transporter [Bacteroidaceae bacterium]|nr:MATE family efflux transporter [Bacteroidaceae bacterium]